MTSLNSIQPFDGLNPFGGTQRELLNEMAAIVSKLDEIYEPVEAIVKLPMTPWHNTAGETTIIAHCLGPASPSSPFPQEYMWEEVTLTEVDGPLQVPLTYITKEGGKNHIDNGFARNRNEMIADFGTAVGPWGAILHATNGTVRVNPIEAGQPILIKMETSETVSGPVPIPMFSGENAFTVTCLGAR